MIFTMEILNELIFEQNSDMNSRKMQNLSLDLEK